MEKQTTTTTKPPHFEKLTDYSAQVASSREFTNFPEFSLAIRANPDHGCADSYKECIKKNQANWEML